MSSSQCTVDNLVGSCPNFDSFLILLIALNVFLFCFCLSQLIKFFTPFYDRKILGLILHHIALVPVLFRIVGYACNFDTCYLCTSFDSQNCAQRIFYSLANYLFFAFFFYFTIHCCSTLYSLIHPDPDEAREKWQQQSFSLSWKIYFPIMLIIFLICIIWEVGTCYSTSIAFRKLQSALSIGINLFGGVVCSIVAVLSIYFSKQKQMSLQQNLAGLRSYQDDLNSKVTKFIMLLAMTAIIFFAQALVAILFFGFSSNRAIWYLRYHVLSSIFVQYLPLALILSLFRPKMKTT